MLPISRILAATDLSPCADWAGRRAARLCAQLKNPSIGLMTVVEDTLPGIVTQLFTGTQNFNETLAEHASRKLQDIGLQLKQDYGVTCDSLVDFGRPASRIASRADEMDADLIVVGAHGCNSITPNFIGNTPYKLLHIGHHPLLIVREEPTRPYLNVLVPVDFSDDSRLAVDMALAIAPDAAVTLLHGFEVINEGLMHYAHVSTEFIGGYRNEARAEALDAMDRFVASLDKGDRLVSTSVQLGYPPSVILEYVRTFKPDLIAIGKHGKSRVQDILLGSVTRHTIEESSCDILVTLSSNRIKDNK